MDRGLARPYFVRANSFRWAFTLLRHRPKATLALTAPNFGIPRDTGSSGFNTIGMNGSAHYNPIAYVKTGADVLTFVECLIGNTSGDGRHSGDPFWEGQAASCVASSSCTTIVSVAQGRTATCRVRSPPFGRLAEGA